MCDPYGYHRLGASPQLAVHESWSVMLFQPDAGQDEKGIWHLADVNSCSIGRMVHHVDTRVVALG